MLITAKQAAKILGVSENCLSIWRMRGVGPPYRQFVPGGTVRYDSERIEDYLDSCEVVPGRQKQSTA